MKSPIRFPLLAKVFAWLLLHLVMLALGFFVFIQWQLGLGLDSLLSGAAGERLSVFADKVAAGTISIGRAERSAEAMRLADSQGLQAALVFSRRELDFPGGMPDNVRQRAREFLPPGPTATPRADHGTGSDVPPPGGGFRPPRERDGFDPPHPPPRPRPRDGAPGRMRVEDTPGEHPAGGEGALEPVTRPVFLMRGDHGDGYWAGVAIHYPRRDGHPREPSVLLIRSDSIDGAGMFFDFKPWLRGGLAVLLLSLVFWTPFVWSVSRYVKRLTKAADGIAAGNFEVSIPERGGDELGDLGRSIRSMATRLDHLVAGQKRFLGDAAHELCAPLARIRTGLGILETRLEGGDAKSLVSIDDDVAELASLVNEILAFSRAGKLEPVRQTVGLREVVLTAMKREAVACDVRLDIDGDLGLTTDPALLGRALGNLIRNAAVHAGPQAAVTIEGRRHRDSVVVRLWDDGPGVPQHELSRLFEPFYRVDRSRSRDSGGSGLGLAIVRTAVEACGGEVQAFVPDGGGFGVVIKLPVGTAGPGP